MFNDLQDGNKVALVQLLTTHLSALLMSTRQLIHERDSSNARSSGLQQEIAESIRAHRNALKMNCFLLGHVFSESEKAAKISQSVAVKVSR